MTDSEQRAVLRRGGGRRGQFLATGVVVLVRGGRVALRAADETFRWFDIAEVQLVLPRHLAARRSA